MVSMVQCPQITRILLFPLFRLLEDPQFLLVSPPNQRPCPAPSPFALRSSATDAASRTVQLLNLSTGTLEDDSLYSITHESGGQPSGSHHTTQTQHMTCSTASSAIRSTEQWKSKSKLNNSHVYWQPNSSISLSNFLQASSDMQSGSRMHACVAACVHDKHVSCAMEKLRLSIGKEWNLNILNLRSNIGNRLLSAIGEAALSPVLSNESDGTNLIHLLSTYNSSIVSFVLTIFGLVLIDYISLTI